MFVDPSGIPIDLVNYVLWYNNRILVKLKLDLNLRNETTCSFQNFSYSNRFDD